MPRSALGAVVDDARAPRVSPRARTDTTQIRRNGG